MTGENEKQANAAEPGQVEEGQAGDVLTRPGWSEVFRQAFDRARREQRANRRELGRDRSRSLFLLVTTAIAVFLLLLGVFSSPNTKRTINGRVAGTPDLGRRVTPGHQQRAQAGVGTPLLSAQSGQPDVGTGGDVTPEEVGRTARAGPSVRALRPVAVTNSRNTGAYALGTISFSADTAPPTTSPVGAASDDLRKASLVFVRDVRSNAASPGTKLPSAMPDENTMTLNLPAGTRLVARLQSVVSSAVKAPVVAAIEYNYERDGQIVVPAGAQVIGSLQQADRSGFVGLRFDRIEMPDGTIEKIDATAISSSFGPLKGVVSGKRTGTNFLIRAFTGIGQAASYVVGSTDINAPLSQGALLRDQIATNIGIAGDQQLNSLAFNQNIVISVPANTRFYVVIEKSTIAPEESRPATTLQTNGGPLPTAEELRQLMQLRQELSALYHEANVQPTAQ
jgi:hypothetical protein